MTWITRDLAKTFLRVDGNDEDQIIDFLIDSAQSQVEAITGLCLTDSLRTLTFDSWGQLSNLPVGPVIAIQSVQYVDPIGAVATLDPASYRVVIRGLRASILPTHRAFPAILDAGAITVALQAGYSDLIPGAVRQALLLTLGDAYSFREDTIADRSVTPTSLPSGVMSLLANFRVY